MAVSLTLLLAAAALAGPESRTHKIPGKAPPCPRLDLFQALHQKETACFREALHHMDVNETDANGDTPLHAAIRLKNKYAIPFLIRNGADLSRRNHQNLTPRELAESQGHRRLTAYLGRIELETERLLAAVDEGNLKAVNAALLRGASVGTTNTRLDSPLHRAAQSNLAEICLLLVRSGAPVHARNYLGETPLHSAALRDFLPTMKVLLEAGANPSALNHRRETPLDLAMVRKDPGVLKLLEKYKATKGSRADVSLEISGGDGMQEGGQ